MELSSVPGLQCLNLMVILDAEDLLVVMEVEDLLVVIEVENLLVEMEMELMKGVPESLSTSSSSSSSFVFSYPLTHRCCWYPPKLSVKLAFLWIVGPPKTVYFDLLVLQLELFDP